MSIVRWDPMKEFEDMQRRFQNYFATPSSGSLFNEQLS